MKDVFSSSSFTGWCQRAASLAPSSIHQQAHEPASSQKYASRLEQQLSLDDDLPNTPLPEEGHAELLEPTEMTPLSDLDISNTPRLRICGQTTIRRALFAVACNNNKADDQQNY